MIPDEPTPEVVVQPKPNKRGEYPTDAEFLEALFYAQKVSSPTDPRAVYEILKAHGYRESTARSRMFSLVERGLVRLNNQYRLEDVVEESDETNAGADTAPQG